MTCSSRSNFPASVRSEGLTELLGDLTLVCTGGAPTTAGAPVPSTDVTITLNTPVTNRKNTTDNFVDALLLVDEPHSRNNPNIPLTLCGAPGVTCDITGTGTGAGTYSGAANRPNVFQGEVTGTNTVRFRLPVDPPGGSGQRILRVVNLRADATRMTGQSPNTITAAAAVGSTQASGDMVLGVVQPGILLVPEAERISWGVRELSGCKPQNDIWAQFPEGDVAPVPEANYAITVREGSIGAWKPRNVAFALAAGRHSGAISASLADVNQNITGYPFPSESGFRNGPLASPAAPFPAIPSTPAFPATRGADRAGAADFGTRIVIRYSNVPSGVSLYLPVEIGVFAGLARSGSAVMVQSDSQGGMQRVSGGPRYGLARMTQVGNTATAIYEVVSSDPYTVESLIIPLVVAYTSTTGGGAPMRLSVNLGPVAGPANPDPTAVIPRFQALAEPIAEDALVFAGGACTATDLSLSFSINSLSSTSGSVGWRVINSGTVTSSGTMTVTAALPAGLTATSISGANWNCALNTLSCTTARPVGAGAFGDGITIAFTVGQNAPATVEFSATVSGGGDSYAANNTARTTLRISGSNPFPLQFQTTPPGMTFTVDGVSYRGNERVSVRSGQTVQLGVPASQSDPFGRSFVFSSWSDSSTANRSYTVTGPGRPLQARFETAPAQMSCEPYQTVAWSTPKSGLTELVRDLVIRCTGGVPTASGSTVPRADIRLTLNTPVTSRLLAGGFSEALLLVDEPHSFARPNIPLLPCGAPGSNDEGAGQCSIQSNGVPANSYNGSAGHPNVFPSRPEGAATLLFRNVPIDPPGPGNYRFFRFSNVRINAGRIASLPYTQIPSSAGAQLTFDPPVASFNASENQAAVASPVDGLENSRQPNGGGYAIQTAILSRCAAANPQIFTDASRGLDTGGQNGAQVTIPVIEGFPGAFSAKSWSVAVANRPPATGISYPADARQDVPDAQWATQMDFFAGSSLSQATYPFSTGGSTPPPAGLPFPAVNGLNAAGAVDSGTRVFLKFTGVPAGVKLFLPVRLAIQSRLSRQQTAQAAWITPADPATGAGAFAPVAGNATGLAQVPVTSGQAVVYYEVLASGAFDLESFAVPVAVAFAAQDSGGTGSISVDIGLAPTSSAESADAASAVPRFAAVGARDNWAALISIYGCGLTINKTNLTFNTTTGANPAPQTIAVTNPANTGFRWSAGSAAAWLTVTPTSGTGAATLTLQPNATGLAAGTYDTTVSVESSGEVTRTAAVRLVVSNPGPVNYDGWVDASTCSAITGWAADRGRINHSIQVSLWTGGAQVASTLASGFRADVGAYLGDNGLHGFSIPIPSNLQDGVRRTYSLRYESSSTTIGSSFDLTCGTPPPPPVTANYTGHVDVAGCVAISGWAADRARLNQAISVEVVEGSNVLATVLANASRPDVGAVLGDNGLHGFSYTVPDSLKTGTARTLTLRYAGTTQSLGGSPRTITCSTTTPPPVTPRYAGYFDSLTCDAATGWAADQNRLNQAISVELVEGTTILATVLANSSRPDVGAVLGDNGLHGFTIPIPDSLKNGAQRTVQIRYAGSTQGLANSPRTLQCGSAPPPPVNARYTGYIDNAGCQVINGWAADLNRLNQAISVDLVEGSTILATVLANSSRPDVGAFLGDNGLHGFSFPTPDALKNGTARTIQVRYSGTTTALGSSPRTITCAGSGTPPPSYAGWVDQTGCSTISGWAADRNRLNTSISVDILEGSTLLATVLANGVRADVGAHLGDNGAHAFSWVTPTALKDGRDHTITVRPAGSSTVLGGQQNLRCTQP